MDKYLKFCFLWVFTTGVFAAPELIDKVLATVNGEMISLSEINEIYVPYAMQGGNNIPEADLKNARKEIFSRILENKLILQEAINQNIEIGKRELENTFENNKKLAGGTDVLIAQLKKEGMTEDGYKEKIKESMMAQRLINDMVRRDIKIGVQDYQEYYQKHSAMFKLPEKVKLYHILIKNSEGKKEDELKAKAEAVVKEIKAGLSFSEAVKKYSEDPSKENGGDLGMVKAGDMPAFGMEPFSLKEGEVSNPIKTTLGVHILKVTEKVAGKQLLLSDDIEQEGKIIPVREIAQNKVLEEIFMDKYKKYINKLKEKAVISIKAEEFR